MNEDDNPLAVPWKAHRFAVYFAPPVGSVWWDAGSVWLGRCAARQQLLPQPPLVGVPPSEQRRLTQAPRRYGWHATLRAPFLLAPGVDGPALRQTLLAICKTLPPFTMPPFKVAMLDGFMALVPDSHSHSINGVAEACVKKLHPLAAPPSAEELRRRRAAGLTPEQDALLLRWGYPFVGDQFRFHLSLTGGLRGASPVVVEAMRRAAEQHFGGLPPCRFESISLFAEPQPDSEFVLLEQFDLVG